jgi:hypothetical protein
MPAFGVLLLLAQIACAVHVVRTGRHYVWIYVVVFVPVVGMAAYLLAEILPELVESRTARRAATQVEKTVNPGRRLREAERRVQLTPTAENKAALAAEYLLAGKAAEAAALYREALAGIHADDPGMTLGLARALFAEEKFAEAQQTLEALQAENPKLHAPEAHLLFARCLEEQGKNGAALAEYRVLVHYYPGQEARCRYAMLLQRSGHGDDARRIFEEICQLVEYGPRYQRFMQREWYDVAKRALGR